MKASLVIIQVFSRWIDNVAGIIHTGFDRFSSRRTVKLVENEAGEFVLQADETTSSGSTPERIRIIEGRIDHTESAILVAALTDSQVELMLQPGRFLFRPLELPNRATEFLNGIVRSQIDRLTPWNADDAAFGWSKPIDTGTDRMVITVASTALALIRPYVQAIAGLGAHSIAVFTAPLEAGSRAIPIKVWEEKPQKTLHPGRIRQALIVVLATAGIAASAAISTSAIVGASLDAQQSDLARQIAIARTTAGASRVAASGLLTSVQRTLEQHKLQGPSIVMVLETLSRILPDHTFVTELRVEGDKLRLVGITRDAPSLIGLIEQSGHFAQATFFAPTTKSASLPGENFHIETIVRPIGSLRS